MTPASPRVGRAVALVVAALAVAACSESTSSPPPTEAVPTTSVTPSTTTTVPATTVAPTTVPTTTAAPATTEPPVTEPPVTDPPSTTEPPVIRELLLRADGIGSATFGAEPEGFIEYLTSFLGAPTSDTGWVEPDEFAICPGTEVRRVEWGVLRVGFGDVSPYAAGRRHAYSWQYGTPGELGGEPQGLRTGNGVALGSAVADLVAAHPEVELYEGDEDLYPPQFASGDDFFGFLTGLGDDDVVTEMFGGYHCGE